VSARDAFPRLVADLGGTLRFFSRLPVPRLSRLDDPAALPRFETAARVVPVAGALLALPAAGAAALLSATGLPPLASGAFVVAVGLLVTGAMHEDGLADTADGLAGGRTRERRLEIMRDSRIGTFGAAALFLALLARASLAGALVEAGAVAAAAALVAAAAVGRGAMVAVWGALPAARPDGMSGSAGRPSRAAVIVALASAVVLALAGLSAAGPGSIAAGLAAAAAVAFLVGRAASRCIGGQTGDILGAVAATAEIAFLAGLLA
jgi:adenosylcobinamide-GDP ribazoletransferase